MTKKESAPFERRQKANMKIAFPVCLSPMREGEQAEVYEKVINAYQHDDPDEDFSFMPENFIIMRERGKEQIIGVIGLHTPTQTCPEPLPTVKYFGGEGLARTDRHIHLKPGVTYEVMRLAILPEWRGTTFLSALLILGVAIYAKGLGGKLILCTNKENLHQFIRYTLGLPVYSPMCPQITWPMASPHAKYWEKYEHVPIVAPLEEAFLTQVGRALREMGAENHVQFDFPCPDPILQPFFQKNEE